MNLDLSDVLKYSDEVAAAIASNSPIVALESTIFSHGLPRPLNLELAREVQSIIRAHGATPAMIAVINGDVHIGLNEAELEAITTRDDILRTSIRELAIAIAFGKSAATTLESASHLAATAGIKVLSTAGLEGVYSNSEESFDDSPELTALSSLAITVVCSGVKSILDIGPTLDRLESLKIDVIGYKTNKFPGMYISESNFEMKNSADTVEEIASKIKNNTSALIVLNPATNPMNKKLHDEILASAVNLAKKEGIAGKAVTPFVIEHFTNSSNGEALRIYVEILKSNAALAAEIAKI